MWLVILRSPLIVTPSTFKKGTWTILADNGGMTRLPGRQVDNYYKFFGFGAIEG